jgi:hypothetical protein
MIKADGSFRGAYSLHPLGDALILPDRTATRDSVQICKINSVDVMILGGGDD